ncbi:hypothetical protein RKD26_000014 [Streptomyces calvus]
MEIVQNIGRALPLNKDGSTEVARIIVPVFLQPGEDPTDMVASASFEPLVAVLRGLRSPDERLVEQLTSRALTSGKRKVHVRRGEEGRIVGAGGEGDGEDQEQDGTQAAAEAALLHFSSPRDAATIAAFLRTRVYRPQSLVLAGGLPGPAPVARGERDHRPVRRPVRRRGRGRRHPGLPAWPLGAPAAEGAAGRGTRGTAQDTAGRPGGRDGLGAGRGSVGGEAGRAAVLPARHGAPRARQDAVWGESEAQGLVPVGQHMANLRRKGGLGKDPKREKERAKHLAAIDPDWNCPRPLNRQRHYRHPADLADDGSLPAIEPGLLFEATTYAKWLERRNPGTWAQLSTQQQRLKLGVQPAQAPSPAPAAARATKGPPGKAQQAFQRGLGGPHAVGQREGADRPCREATQWGAPIRNDWTKRWLEDLSQLGPRRRTASQEGLQNVRCNSRSWRMHR